MLYECILKQLVILDSAVVDNGKVSIFAVMWMGIAIRRLAVRRPASVGNAVSGLRVLVLAIVDEVVHLAVSLVYIDLAVAPEGDAGTVVSTVFEAVKPLNENIVNVTVSHISYNSAHSCLQ